MVRFLLHFCGKYGSTASVILARRATMGRLLSSHRSDTAAEALVLPPSELLFWGSLFAGLDRSGAFLQLQIRQMIVTAIEEGRLPLGVRMPSSRDLAAHLKVSRNTIVIAYEQLVDQNFLVSRERSGYFVAGLPKQIGTRPDDAPAATAGDEVRWAERFALQPSGFRNIVKPLDWQNYPYPFIFGQFDPSLFPTNDWRESARAGPDQWEGILADA